MIGMALGYSSNPSIVNLAIDLLIVVTTRTPFTIIVGRNTRTATYKAAEAMAKSFGADDETAMKIGLAVDIAVPPGFAFGIGATRIASVKAGRIKLIEH